MRKSDLGMTVLGAALSGVALGIILATGPLSAPSAYLPPCQTEDSEECFWHATERGNGSGVSFIDYRGVTYYPR